MIDKDNLPPDPNAIGNSIEVFVDYYNENIPKAFPRATIGALAAFRSTHPDLFKGSKKWTIDRHRKKLMDWLASYKDEGQV